MNTSFSAAELAIKGVYELTPFVAEDNRGYFLKDFEAGFLESLGIMMQISEVDESYSHRGVLRGLHFQSVEPQAKLVRVIKGEAFDVAVDLRRNSPTYKKWIGVYLDDKKRNMVYIPAGFAHGYLALSDEVYFTYKCSGRYHKEADGGINWRDEQVGVIWPLEKVPQVIMTEKDENLPRLSEIEDTLNF